MINLFKFPFRVKPSPTPDGDAAPDLAAGLLRNYLRQHKNLSEQDLDRACEIAAHEMNLLREQFREPGLKNNYDLFSTALRRIESNLGL